MVNLRNRFSLLVAVLVICCGCGSKTEGPATAAVTGEVTLDGVPVAGADVSFLPAADGANTVPAQAVTDDAGKFEVISVFDQGKTTKPGMTPGNYSVEVSLLQRAPAGEAFTAAPKNALPEKYASAATSGLQVTVDLDGENHFPLKLTK